MNAERDLTTAYLEWRRLTEAEGDAIGSQNWGLVTASQAALQQLQARITALSSAARKEWSKPGCDFAAKEKDLNATIRELITLEHRNQTLLGSIQQATRATLDQLNQAGRNLKRIHRSYIPIQPAAWTSFS